MKGRDLLKNSIIILIISIFAKFASFIWETILAAKLGTTYQADALYMVLGIFGILYPILDIGIWKVFLPTYKQKMVKNSNQDADDYTNKFETLFLLISLLLVFSIIIFAKPLVFLIAPGFSDQLKDLTVDYLRISAPMYLLMASSSIFGAILQCHGKFFGSQIREVVSHISKIVIFLIFFKSIGVYAALLACIIASVFRLLIQIPFIDWGYKYKIDLDFKDKNILRTIKSLPSVSITVAIMQINALVDKIIASVSVEGAVSCLNYGNKLMNIFSGMITTSLATAIYPNMSEYVANDDKEKIAYDFKNAIIISIVTIVPITFFCFLYSNDIVSLAFERGSFNSNSTLVTSAIFKYYSIGMLFTGLTTILSNIFYAYGDTKTTLKISIFNVLLNIFLNIILYNIVGINGLPIATSISAIICFFVRMKCLNKFIVIDYSSIKFEIVKIVFASLLSCIIPFFIFYDLIVVSSLIKLIVSLILIIILFVFFSFVFKIEIIFTLFRIAKLFIFRKNNMQK